MGQRKSMLRDANILIRACLGVRVRVLIATFASDLNPAPPNSPLDPSTIHALQERIGGLLPPQLTAFSQAFRSAFQVPDSTPSIAGLITEQRHRIWIEQVLRQGPEQLQAGNA